MKEYWKLLKHKNIIDGYEISTNARFRVVNSNLKPFEANYHSMNGYDFVQLIINEFYGFGKNLTKHFPVDDLVAQTFIPIPDELIDKPIKVEHIDGNLRNNHYENLRWVEDIEEWRDIPGFERLYEINQWGAVRNKITLKIHNNHYDKDGYDHTGLYDLTKDKRIDYRIHRLVVMCFHENYIDKLPVNHIDEDVHNNYYKNLEQISVVQNNIFGERLNKSFVNKINSVMCIETGIRYDSVKIAELETGINAGQICSVCNGSANTAGGYHWMYFDKDPVMTNNGIQIRCVETGEIYQSVRKLCKILNISKSTLRRHLLDKTQINGLTYEYVDESNYNVKHWSSSKESHEKSRKTIVKLYGKPVRCIETNEEYDSIRKCSREMNIGSDVIKRCCENPDIDFKGLHFEYIRN